MRGSARQRPWLILIVLLLGCWPASIVDAQSLPVSGAATADRHRTVGQLRAPLLDTGTWYPDVTVWDDWFGGGASWCDGAAVWYARTELAALFRDNNVSLPLATVGASGPIALSAADLPNDAAPALRVSLGRSLGTRSRVEFIFEGTHTWDGQVAVRNLDANSQGGFGNLYSALSDFGTPAPIVGVDFNELAAVRLQSRMTNAELNLRRRVLFRPRLYATWFVIGSRYIDTRDRLRHWTASATPGPALASNTLQSNVGNRLVGFQIGLSNRFEIEKHAWISFDALGGIFYNRANLSRQYDVVAGDGSTTTFTGADTAHAVSLVGDLALQFHYEFAPAWTFVAGYRAVWMTGVAVAEANFPPDETALIFAQARVNHDREAVYHGQQVGLQFAW